MMHLVEDQPDFSLNLGFDACCTCGENLESSAAIVTCNNCRRVKYCSENCRQQDTEVCLPAQQQVAEEAMGHSSVICALLRCCQDDEEIENSPSDHNLSPERREKAIDRIQSEIESYPATLSNALMAGPCYAEVMKKCSATSKKLTIHLIGASEDAELWDASRKGADSSMNQAYNSYAEALSDLAASKRLPTIELWFIGPDCPSNQEPCSRSLKSGDGTSIGELHFRILKGEYNSDVLQECDGQPDIVVFFNPGFTVPDYNWKDALSSIQNGTPFLSTTNTELEGIADCQYLLDQDKIETIPIGLAEIFGLYSGPDDDEEGVSMTNSFFSVNPFSGSRVRQSGTMANDLFVKNRWMLGGILDVFDQSKAVADKSPKRMRTEPTSNQKSGNPALI